MIGKWSSIARTALPIINGSTVPSFDIITVHAGQNTSNTRANGKSALLVLMTFSPNPIGGGFCINIGMVERS